MRRWVVGMLVLAALCSACASDGAAPPTPHAAHVDTSETSSAPSTSAVLATLTTEAARATVAAITLDPPAGEGPSAPQAARRLPTEVFSSSTRAQAPAASGPEVTGRIIIPSLGLDHITYEGIELKVINHGPSHWPGTAMPGEIGNTVFPGHRTTYSRPFYSINELVVGDRVTFETADGVFHYAVTETFVVYPDETWIVQPTSDPTFTIFACHPRGSARQRYVVKGELVEAIPNTTTTTTTAPPPTTTTTGMLGGLFGGGNDKN